MKNQEAFIDKLEAVRAGNYSMGTPEMQALYSATASDAGRAMILAFRYGFLRGQNAEKNRRKKK